MIQEFGKVGKAVGVGLAVVCGILWQGAIGWAGDDFQTWHALEVTKRLGKSFEAFFRPEVRIRDNSGELFYHEYRQGLRWKQSEHLEIGLNYLFVRSENSSGKHRDEHTGELDVTPKTKLGPWDLSLRGRLALRTIEGSAGEQEYVVRLMPKVAYPTSILGHKVTPYVADDLFYDYTRDAFNQNRLFVGVSFPLAKPKGVGIGLDLFYMFQSQLGVIRHDWSSNHILGSKINVKLD